MRRRFDVEQDAVAGSDDGERAADGGLRRDVQHDGAEGSAAHARVGDAHHVFDALARELHGDGQIAGFGHAGRAFGAGVAQDEDVVGGDVEVGRVDAAAMSSSESKTTARPVWRIRCGDAAECLMTALRGREIAVEDRHRAFVS